MASREQLLHPESAELAVTQAMNALLQREDVGFTFFHSWESGVDCDCREEEIIKDYDKGQCPCRDWDCYLLWPRLRYASSK
jgi:hypothetical protein